MSEPAERRRLVLAAVAAEDPALSAEAGVDAVDAVVTTGAALRDVASAIEADPAALACGAPPSVGRLVHELIARGSTALSEPACVRCGRTGRPLIRSLAGGVCARCRRRQLAAACSRCGVVKPIAGRVDAGAPVCARCADRPQRRCGRCGQVRRIAARARDRNPDICERCFRLPEAVCSRCGRRRPCSFAASRAPICAGCAPRRKATCAHCGASRPPVARWPEGPVCDSCYTAALRHRGTCDRCGETRRLVAPPGPAATACADCAGGAGISGHVCSDCGIEDKLYERGRCPRCALRRRTGVLLRAGTETVPAELEPIYRSIIATSTPRTALNWLRKGAGATLLGELAAGRLALSHEALDAHPHLAAAAYLRQMLVANGALAARDEALARTEARVGQQITAISRDADRRLLQAYATWRVLRRLRRSAEKEGRPRTYTHHARVRVNAAITFLDWLAARKLTLAAAGQADVEEWLAGGSARYNVRDFLLWAAERGHCQALHVPALARNRGAATDAEKRWTLLARLLHDDSLELTDRVAGSLLLLYGQQLSRIAAMRTDQLRCRDEQTFLRFGAAEVVIPEPLDELLVALARDGRRYRGVGSPPDTDWLFPGMHPGQPLTAKHLGLRLRRIGVYALPGRRAALMSLAAQLPAAVLADLLNVSPTTAVGWVRDAGGDWSRYAAELARARSHQP